MLQRCSCRPLTWGCCRAPMQCSLACHRVAEGGSSTAGLQCTAEVRARAAAGRSRTLAVPRRLVCGSATSLPLLVAAAPVALPPSAWHQLAGNYVFVVGFAGWFLAQFLKIFTKWYKTGVLTPMTFFDSGGTPSSHSSLCSAITTAVALQHGVGSSLFAVATAFSVIVMYDAMGVRRHAGLQASAAAAPPPWSSLHARGRGGSSQPPSCRPDAPVAPHHGCLQLGACACVCRGKAPRARCRRAV